MKHIGFAVVAAAVLAVVGPRITPNYAQVEKPAAQSTAPAASGPVGRESHPVSMLRMRAGDGYPSDFDRR